jgi:hypothetical protein
VVTTVFTEYEKCPKCEAEDGWGCTQCDGEGYVEIDKKEPEPKPDRFTVFVVFLDGATVTYTDVIGYGPIGERWDAYVVETTIEKAYINFNAVQNIEVTKCEEES